MSPLVFLAVSATPAFMLPGVGSSGALTRMPSISGEPPLAPSATATPLSVVLPAT